MKLLAITLILLSPSADGAERIPLPQQLFMADRAYIEAVDARNADGAQRALERVAELGGRVPSPSGHYEILDLRADIERAVAAGLQLDFKAREGSPIPWRGRRGGPSQTRYMLEPGQPISEQAVYVGGELAAVYARASYAVPVHLIISSSDGATVCEQSSGDGRALCTWLPTVDQHVEIRVFSNGGEHTELRLFSN